MKIKDLIPSGRPVLVLAPMQDVTDLPFWKIMQHYGGPDIYFTEYFRVHRDSTPERHIVRDIRGNPSGKPIVAQMIGEDIPSLVRTAKILQKLPVIGIDLNLGCPAPVVCRKSAGGALLKNPSKIDEILRALRETVEIDFTVKTRIGFGDPSEFEALLEVFAKHPIDALTIHGRTVKEMYRSHVHYDKIAQAVSILRCPVIANGNVISPQIAKDVASQTGAAGLMIGRGAIRSPWLFNQIREVFGGGEICTKPSYRDMREYIGRLYEETRVPEMKEIHHVAKMKKYMNFIAQEMGSDEAFLHEIRRATNEKDFFEICDRHLYRDGYIQIEPSVKNLINSGNPRLECYGNTGTSEKSVRYS